MKAGVHHYRVRDPRHFACLTEAMHACAAYHDPVDALDKLLTGESRYGVHVARSDKHDALASATLTSIFSFGFAHRLLASNPTRSVLDCGCGTGEFLSYLRHKGYAGRLYGMDLAEDAIRDGQSMGFGTQDVTLFVGDVLALEAALESVGSPELDVLSFMFVLHEFSDEQIASVLTQIRRTCPRARVLLTELERRSSDETRRARRTMLPELKFVHQLSKQVLRSSNEWKELFASAGYHPVAERINRLTNQTSLLLAP
jgi:ubiquinone/menaquinone biosynthesis C-methylase UbiE